MDVISYVGLVLFGISSNRIRNNMTRSTFLYKFPSFLVYIECEFCTEQMVVAASCEVVEHCYIARNLCGWLRHNHIPFYVFHLDAFKVCFC